MALICALFGHLLYKLQTFFICVIHCVLILSNSNELKDITLYNEQAMQIQRIMAMRHGGNVEKCMRQWT